MKGYLSAPFMGGVRCRSSTDGTAVGVVAEPLSQALALGGGHQECGVKGNMRMYAQAIQGQNMWIICGSTSF